MKRLSLALMIPFFLSALSQPAKAQVPVLSEAPRPNPALLEAKVVAGPALSDLAAYALLTNPSVRAARAGRDAALGASSAAGWWPDPTLSLEKSLDTDMWKATLAQPIPFPGASGAASDAAAAQARAAEYSLSIAVRDQLRKAAESFWELAYLREAADLARRNRDLLAQVVAAGESGYASGRDALAEVLRARSQAAQADYDVLLLGEMAEVEAARLNALLDRPAAAPIGPLSVPSLPDLAITPGEADRLAAENFLEAHLADEEVARAQAMVRLTRRENLPMFEVGGSYEKGGNRNLMASLSLPVWFGRNRGRTEAANAEFQTAQAERDEVRAMARAEAREAFYSARNARRLVALYNDTLLPQAARAMESSQALYRQGTGNYSDMVETAAAWNNFQVTAARARSDYGKALARLSAVTGTPVAWGASAVAAAAASPAFAASLDPSRGEVILDAPSPFAPSGAVDLSAPLSPVFTLAQLQAQAFHRAPAVAAADKEARASLQAYSQASELSDLLRRYSAFSGAGQEAAMLYPSPGPIALQGKIVDAEVRAAAAKRESARRAAVTAAARAFWELAFNREAQKVAKAEQDRLSQVAASVSARYQAGEASFSDLADAEAALKTADAETASLRADQSAREAQVREALGLGPSSEVGEPVPAALPVDVPGVSALESLALSRSPDLSMLRAEVERMELMVQMGRREGYPGYSQNLSLSDNRFLGGQMEAMPPSPAGAGLGPAWIRELDGRLSAAREDLRRAEAQVVREVREAWAVFDRARREAGLFERDLVPLAGLSAESALRSFEAGKGDLSRAIAAISAASDTTLARERKRSDLGIAFAELAAAAGGRLDR